MNEELIEATYGETKTDSIIKVIGVGGAGCNAVQHMYKEGIVGVDFIVCNTDRQSVDSNAVPCKLVIGETGLGAGADPQKAQKLAEQTEDKIKSLIGGNTKMLFITAGMGKGTGTGASPVVARIAHEMGILTIGVVTYPYRLEQKPARMRADSGIEELKKYVDSLIVIKNQKIMEEYSSVKLSVALGLADDVLKNAVKCIAELITVEGYQNVDYSDVESIMRNSGEAMIALAEASGDNRAEDVVRQAMTCPILEDVNITDAQNFLFFLRYGEDNEPTMGELDKIETEFRSYINEDTHVIFGHAADKNLGEKIRLSVVITNYAKKEDHVVSLGGGSNGREKFAEIPAKQGLDDDPFFNRSQVNAEETSKAIDITDIAFEPIAPSYPQADATGLSAQVNRQGQDAQSETSHNMTAQSQMEGVHLIDSGANVIYDNDQQFINLVTTPAYKRQQSVQTQASNSRLMEIESSARKLPQPNYSPAVDSLIFGNIMAD